MGKYVSLIVFFLICFFILNSNTSAIKCPFEVYNYKGKIISDNNIQISNALITIFEDKAEYGHMGYSSENGEFEVRCLNNTEKHTSIFGVTCGHKPESITIIVNNSKYFSRRLEYKIKEIKEGNVIIVPEIVLIKLDDFMLDMLKTNGDDLKI